jgi:predicted RNase H-like HicB family nuclease
MGRHPKAGRLVMKYLVVYEKGPANWGAYAPDLPGYAATAPSLDVLRELVREGIPFHVEGLRLAGQRVPEPASATDFVEVA